MLKMNKKAASLSFDKIKNKKVASSVFFLFFFFWGGGGCLPHLFFFFLQKSGLRNTRLFVFSLTCLNLCELFMALPYIDIF